MLDSTLIVIVKGENQTRLARSSRGRLRIRADLKFAPIGAQIGADPDSQRRTNKRTVRLEPLRRDRRATPTTHQSWRNAQKKSSRNVAVPEALQI
jgi:hypothetical protein